MNIEIDDDVALQMLMNRVDEFDKPDRKEREAWEQFYKNRVSEYYYDGGKFDVNVIVDNDIVNYTAILDKSDFSKEVWAEINKAGAFTETSELSQQAQEELDGFGAIGTIEVVTRDKIIVAL